MNKIYDKLLLAVALLLLAAGLGAYVLFSGEPGDRVETVTLNTDALPYASVDVPETETVEASWPVAPEQFPDGPNEDPWIYEVFTPPKIYVDPDTGEFTQKGARPPPPFGVYLASIKRNLYRLNAEGYIGEYDPANPGKTLILLLNRETDKNLYVQQGGNYPEVGIKVLDFQVTKNTDPNGNISSTVSVVLEDSRINETITLVQGEPRYADGISIRFRSNEHPSFEAVLEEAGQTFSTPSADYELLSVDPASGTVEVKRLESELHKEMIKTLFERTPEPKSNSRETEPKPSEEEPEDSADTFDSLFG